MLCYIYQQWWQGHNSDHVTIYVLSWNHQNGCFPHTSKLSRAGDQNRCDAMSGSIVRNAEILTLALKNKLIVFGEHGIPIRIIQTGEQLLLHKSCWRHSYVSLCEFEFVSFWRLFANATLQITWTGDQLWRVLLELYETHGTSPVIHYMIKTQVTLN